MLHVVVFMNLRCLGIGSFLELMGDLCYLLVCSGTKENDRNPIATAITHIATLLIHNLKTTDKHVVNHVLL